MTRCFLALVLAATLVPALSALADIAPEPQYGQSLAPKKTTVQVEMTEETVNITLGAKTAHVEAVFSLANRGPAVKFEVGFPDVVVPSSWGAGEPEGVSEYKLRNFGARLDGEKVEHTYKWVQGRDSPKVVEEIAELERRLKTAASEVEKRGLQMRLKMVRDKLEDWTYLGWLVWEMSFPAGKTRKVEVSYDVEYIPAYGPTLLGERRFEYILKTGAGWKGNIGKAAINVVFGEGVTAKQIGSIAPSGSRSTETGFSWLLTDFEPEADVTFTVKRYPDHAAAAKAYHGWWEKSSSEGRPDASMLATAALCEEAGGLFEECAGTCRKIIALEEEGRPKYVLRWFKDSYEPWQCRLARCLDKLGRSAEAADEAAKAVAIVEALLARTDRKPPYVNEKRMQELLAEGRRIAASK